MCCGIDQSRVQRECQMVNTPYQDDAQSKGVWRRTFDQDVADAELIWHQDRNQRWVTVLEGENWQLQLDNQLPQTIKQGATYVIPAHVYHRLIKGDSDLVVQIVEPESTHQESHLQHPQMHRADRSHQSLTDHLCLA